MTDIQSKIQKLIIEIEALDSALDIQQQKQEIKRAWQEHQNIFQKAYLEGNEEATDNTAENLQLQIRLLQEITEVTIEHVETEIIEQDELYIKKRKGIQGSCGDVDFKLKMEIEESMHQDMTVDAKVTRLIVSVSENLIGDLNETIQRMTTDCNVQGFLMLLRPYNICQSARSKTFQHFTTVYPTVATPVSQDILHLKHPDKNCTFVIKWQFKVNNIYNVLPDIKLAVIVSEQVKSLTLNDVYNTAPDTFQIMLQELGVEKALNCLMKLLTE